VYDPNDYFWCIRSRVWLETTYRLIVNEDTGKPEIVGVSRDISGKKALEM
jgi:hypothetical protein